MKLTQENRSVKIRPASRKAGRSPNRGNVEPAIPVGIVLNLPRTSKKPVTGTYLNFKLMKRLMEFKNSEDLG